MRGVGLAVKEGDVDFGSVFDDVEVCEDDSLLIEHDAAAASFRRLLKEDARARFDGRDVRDALIAKRVKFDGDALFGREVGEAIGEVVLGDASRKVGRERAAGRFGRVGVARGGGKRRNRGEFGGGWRERGVREVSARRVLRARDGNGDGGRDRDDCESDERSRDIS